MNRTLELVLRMLQEENNQEVRQEQIEADRQFQVMQLMYAKEQEDLKTERAFTFELMNNKKAELDKTLETLRTLS